MKGILFFTMLCMRFQLSDWLFFTYDGHTRFLTICPHQKIEHNIILQTVPTDTKYCLVPLRFSEQQMRGKMLQEKHFYNAQYNFAREIISNELIMVSSIQAHNRSFISLKLTNCPLFIDSFEFKKMFIMIIITLHKPPSLPISTTYSLWL